MVMVKNPILRSISEWFRRNFADPAALGLFFTLLVGFLLIEFLGNWLAPLIAGVVIAYLLNGLVLFFERRCKFNHIWAVITTFIVFIGVVVLIILGLFPIIWKQLASLVAQIPNALDQAQKWAQHMIQKHPKIFASLQLKDVIMNFRDKIISFGQATLSYSFAIIPNVFEILIYAVLVPLLVFFILKDRDLLMGWSTQFMPTNRYLVKNVWAEVNREIGNYVRGRIIEIVIVTIVCLAAFLILGLKYALLLAVIVGLGTIIPYVGPTIATIPVLAVGLVQWGWSAHFVYLVIVYAVIVVLDGNVLVPVLFSETMDLNATAIIVAVVIFGRMWGFWGVFFAIPLATLVKAVLDNWPRSQLNHKQ